MSDHDDDDERDDDEHEKHHGHKGEIVRVTDPKAPEGTDPRAPLAFLERAQDTLTVRRVFGEPIERNGVTIIPVASLGGGGGGGGGEGPQAQGRGWGGGFGIGAKPAGVYVVRPDGTVAWKPAVDVNRAALVGQLVAVVFLLTVRSVVKALAKRR